MRSGLPRGSTASPLRFIRAAASLFLFFGLASLCSSLRAQLKVGDSLPALKPELFEGAVAPELKGSVVMIDFWASWCAPCKASFPAYGRLKKDLAPKGLVILAVSVDQDKAAYVAFVQKQRPPFTVLHDKTQAP